MQDPSYRKLKKPKLQLYNPPIKKYREFLLKRPQDGISEIKADIENYKQTCIQTQSGFVQVPAIQTPSDIVEEILYKIGDNIPPYNKYIELYGPRRLILDESLVDSDSSTKQK